MFKQLFGVYAKYLCNSLSVKFTESEFITASEDQSGVCVIVVKFNGNKMNTYYCKDDETLCYGGY